MTKISDLPVLAAVDLDATADIIPIVDMSETAGARNKRIAVSELASALGAGDMLASNNLSDLVDISDARDNLDVYSKGEVDGAIAGAGGGDMLASNNLSDVASASTARNNLDVYSTAEVDAAIAGVGGSARTPPVSTDFATVVNSPTVSDGTVSLKLLAAAATPSVRARLRSLPGTDFTVIMKMKANLQADANSAGIVFRDSAGKFVSIALVHLGTNNLVSMDQFSSSTAYASTAASLNFDESDLPPQWFKAFFNNTTKAVTGYWSYTGDNWETIGTSTYLGTPNAVGFAGIPNNTTTPIKMFIEHWSLS